MKKSDTQADPYLVNVGSPSVQGTLLRPLFHVRLEILCLHGLEFRVKAFEHCVLGRLTVKSTMRYFFQVQMGWREGLSNDPDRLVPGIPSSR